MKKKVLSPESRKAMGEGARRRMASLSHEERRTQSQLGVQGRLKALAEYRAWKESVNELLEDNQTTVSNKPS